MKCSLCLHENRGEAGRCAGCGATLHEISHREYQGIVYLLGQLTRWGEEGTCPPEVVARLRAEYIERRRLIRDRLMRIRTPGRASIPGPESPIEVIEPPPPPPAAAPAVETVPEPGPDVRIIEVVEPPAPPSAPVPRFRRESVLQAPPEPPRPPFSWKNLLTERNIRWILNLGIFIFSTALAVFIHTQWKGMAPALKVSILFGSSLAAIGVGHWLRGTILKATGMALVILGALAVPIDVAALVQFGLIPARHADGVGLAGSLFSLAVYLALARLYSERLFVVLGTLAGAAAWAFVLRLFGTGWPVVVPWLAPLALGLSLAPPGLRPVAVTARWILTGTLIVSAGLLAAGLLDVRTHGIALEAALACAVAAAAVARRRTGSTVFSWGAMLLLGAMFAVGAGYGGFGFFDCWPALALLGAAFGLGWLWGSRAFMTGSVAAGVLSFVSAEFNFHQMVWVLAVPAALHAAYGFAKGNSRHAFAGWLLGGLALSSALGAMEVPRLRQPLYYALYGVAMASLARVSTRDAFHLLGAAGAGLAMVLLAAWYPEYYRFKPAAGGRPEQLLGAAIAAVSALAFGPVANRIRSRFVSDITYGCIGFALILALRWAYVPGKWLGLTLAGFAVAYALFEKKIERWLLRPTFFTGVACTAAAAVFASLQWFVWGEPVQAALTYLLIGGFYLAVAQHTPHRWLSHVGLYVAAAGWLAGLEALRVDLPLRAFLTFLPAGWTLIVAARRRDFHLGVAALVVCGGALAWTFLNPMMYGKANLPATIVISLAAAALAGWFAFSRHGLPSVDVSLMSGAMGVFASLAYVLFLRYLSKGSPWGGLAVFGMSAALCGAGGLLRRFRFERQAWPLAAVSTLVTGAAALVAHDRGMAEGVHLWVYGLSLALYTAAGRAFRRVEFSWLGAAAGAAGLCFWLLFWENPWIGVCTFVLAGLALQDREKPLACLGLLSGVLCPLHAVVQLGASEAGVVLVAMTALLAFTRLRPLTLYTMALAAWRSFPLENWNLIVLFSGFGIFLSMAFVLRKPLYVYASLVLALLGDYALAMRFEAHAGLVAYPLALVLLAMAWEAGRRYGEAFGRPLAGASFAAAVLATAFSLHQPDDRIAVFAGDAVLFGVSAGLFRQPVLVYPCAASFVGLALSSMVRFGLPPVQMAFWMVSLALAQILFVRAMGDRMRRYLQPVFVGALVIAAGAVAFGVSDPRRALGPEITWSIWGLVVTAAVFGVAGRIRRIPAFLFLAGASLLGAYYLALHKYSIRTMEFHTVPLGIALAAWGLMAFRRARARSLVEVLAAGMLFVPSAALSYAPGEDGHALAALTLAFLLVLAGMAMRRRVYLLGGTGLFVAEVLGKALQFLIRQHLSMAGWGMILGGLMILVAAAFEARKARFVKERLGEWKDGARRYIAGLE